jgi:regulatory factor X 1/2/3
MYPEGSLELGDNGFELDGHVSHTAQAAPVTVQWLVDNFEPAEGCSLRRSSLYNFYMHHCEEQKIEPVNPASFGKLIRSVFLGLRTRRLGTR